MEYIPFSFIFGMLTVLSPCVLPLLPTILAGSLGYNDKKRIIVIVLSLSISIILFSIFLKSGLEIVNNFAGIPDNFWFIVSGAIISIYGIFMLFPTIWDNISLRIGLKNSSDNLLNKSATNDSLIGQIILGASLGPIFTSCSPTYVIITKTLILDSFFVSLINIVIYTIGLSIMIFVIAFYGQIAIKRLKWASNPHGLFRKFLGVFMIIFGILIALGILKEIEVFLLDNTPLDIVSLETSFIERTLDE